MHLLNNGGEQHSVEYQQINPQQLVPTLLEQQAQQPFILSQSLSILEYLEEKFNDIPLLPTELQQRARIRAFCQSIACHLHPLKNLRLLQ